MKKINTFKKLKAIFIVFSFLTILSASAIAPSIPNGSFETPDATSGNVGLPGVLQTPITSDWVFEGNSFIMKNGCAYGPPNAVDGVQCAAIQNGGDLYQNINFDAGTYILTFSAAQRNGNADNIPVVVSVDGTTISTLTATSSAYFSPLQTASFTVTAGVHKIQLTTTQTAHDCTVFIDNAIIYLSGTWDQRLSTSFSATYNQNFSSAWDAGFDAVFQGQWTTLGAFGASNVSTGAINFNWIAQRIMATKYLSIPYTITADIDYQNSSNRGGIVLRETSGILDYMQETAFGDPGFNKEGIALYPSADGSSFIVQFNGVPVANTTGNTQAKIFLPAPASITLLSRNTLKVEDYGTSVYVFYNGNPYIRIELGGKVGTHYTSGVVYDANMNVAGVFSGMAIESLGQAALAMRDAVLRLYSAKIEMVTNGGNMETGKPSISFTPNYTQTFSSWAATDQTTFGNQWDVVDAVSNLGFSTDHLQMGWPAGRVIASKTAVATPYVFENDIQVLSVNESNGGVVVRADAANDINNFQEPGSLALQPNFNSEGIAVFASPDATGLNIQLSEALQAANATVLHRYYIPGAGSAIYRNRGVIRIEDYGTSLYVYYSGAAFARIDLADLVGNNYTSAMVYNNQGSLVGACSNIVVPQTGKFGVSNRFGAANHSINVYRLNVEIPKNVTVNSDTNISTLILAPLSDIVVSSNKLTINQATTVNSITVAPGAKLELTSGNTLTAGTVTLQSDASGTATLVDNTTNTPQAVTATVQQYLTSGRNWYFSSPVTDATSNVFSASAQNPVYWYDEAHGSSVPWATISNTSTSLNVMQGYVVNPASTGVVTFSGTLNTGAKEIAVNRTAGQTKEGFNLVGNPYPSYLNWTNVTKTHLSTTIWYRTKTAPAPVTGATSYVFDTYNATGGVGTSLGSKAVTNLIPPMQAFWVRVDAGQPSGTLTVSNSQRAHADNGSNGFKSKSSTASTQPLLRLEISNGLTSDQALVYFNAVASNSFDNYDSPKMTNATASIPEIYTLAGNQQVSINGVNDLTQLTLGFTTGEANNFTIKASQFSNFVSGTQIILRDNLLNVDQDLTVADYKFYSDITANNEIRFTLLVKAPSIATGINQNAKDNVWISTNSNGQIVVNGVNGETTVAVYNSVGQKLLTKMLKSNSATLDNSLTSGVFIVTVNNNGKLIFRKVIID